jgi:predicted dehydrogenase
MKQLRLGVIGLSPGNGHPYSWSAIFNGYDRAEMEACPFPAIPAYLGRQSFPADAIAAAAVTHVWTQDRAVSEAIARAARIAHVLGHPDAMIGAVDAVLLARDDAENHRAMAAPFLAAGLPIFIDKPLAYDVPEARRIYAAQRVAGQIFTGSALAHAPEFRLDADQRRRLGAIRHVEATTPKSWDLYAIHVIEPLLAIMAEEGPVRAMTPVAQGDACLDVTWSSGATARVTALGDRPGGLRIAVQGRDGAVDMALEDTFRAFKASLVHFVRIVRGTQAPQDPETVIAAIAMLEAGRRNGGV